MEKYLRILGIGEGSFKWVLIYNEDGIDKKDKPIDEQDEMVRKAYIEQREIIEAELKNQLSEIDNNELDDNRKMEETNKVSKEYEIRLSRLEEAYNALRTSALRKITEFKSKISKVKESRKLNFPSAYKNLGFLEEYINSFSDKRTDELIKDRYIEIMQAIEEALSDKKLSDDQRNDIKNLRESCKENYRYIANAQIRSKYSEYLDNKEFEKKYSKKSQFNSDLIFSDGKEFKVYEHKTNDSMIVYLKNDKSIKKDATLSFINATGIQSYINRYEVKRYIDDKELIDYVYTDINFQQLARDRNTGVPLNPEYYNCVSEQLLSDEMIKASKFNSGYVGLVENGSKGYYTTLNESNLNGTEQEYLTAVMIYEQSKNENIKQEEENQKESDDGR